MRRKGIVTWWTIKTKIWHWNCLQKTNVQVEKFERHIYKSNQAHFYCRITTVYLEWALSFHWKNVGHHELLTSRKKDIRRSNDSYNYGKRCSFALILYWQMPLRFCIVETHTHTHTEKVMCLTFCRSINVSVFIISMWMNLELMKAYTVRWCIT